MCVFEFARFGGYNGIKFFFITNINLGRVVKDDCLILSLEIFLIFFYFHSTFCLCSCEFEMVGNQSVLCFNAFLTKVRRCSGGKTYNNFIRIGKMQTIIKSV